MSLITEKFLAAIRWRALSADEEKRLLEIDSSLKCTDAIYLIDKEETSLPIADKLGKIFPEALKSN